MLMLESLRVALRRCAAPLLAGGAMFYCTGATALGLGDLTLHSALNQPLRAEIALVDAAGLSEADLSVSLATADEFGRAGVDRVFFLNDLRFTPIVKGNRSLIRVTSNKPVKEPYLNFLLALNQPNGRVLREFTVLIDPPGAPGIVPLADEPPATAQSSEFPSVTPAAPAKPAKAPAKTVPSPAATPPANELAAEQLAASVLQNQQLQTSVDELKKQLQDRDEQIAAQQKALTELQTRLAEIQQAPPAPPVVPTPAPEAAPAPVAPVEPESDSGNGMLLAGLLAVALLVLLGLVIRRRRQASAPPIADPIPEPSASRESAMHESPRHESMLQHTTPLHAAHHLTLHHDSTPGADVLEAVGIYLAYGRLSEAAVLLREGLHKEPERIDLALQLLEVLGRQGDVDGYNAHEQSLVQAGVDAEVLAEIRARYPRLAPLPAAIAAAVPTAAPITPVIAAAAPIAAAAVVPPAVVSSQDDFQLNLDDLSMDANWDLISPFDHAPAAAPKVEPAPAFTSNLHVLPDVFEFSKEPPEAELEELEWVADPEAQALDDGFLDEFADDRQTLELEPLSLDTGDDDFSDLAAAPVGKLEQAQTCIDDGDIDSAIALLNELLREGDDQLKQTARSLLAGIR